MPTLTRYERSDTHKTNFAGIRVVSSKPILLYPDATDGATHAIGAIAYNSSDEKIYINTTGTIYGWKATAAAT